MLLRIQYTTTTHFLFSYFTSLVDAYSKCLAPQEELKQRLVKESEDRLRTLTRIQQYASFVRERDRKNERASRDLARRRPERERDATRGG